MSDEDILVPSSEPTKSRLPLYATIGAGVLGIFWLTRKKKKDDDDSEKKEKTPTAKANQVMFSKDFSTYEVGDLWYEKTLEPYLLEAVEDDLLATPEWKEKGPIGWGMTDEALFHHMNHTRQKVLSGFYATHYAHTPKEKRVIAKLPDTDAVEDFFHRVDDLARNFQENY